MCHSVPRIATQKREYPLIAPKLDAALTHKEHFVIHMLDKVSGTEDIIEFQVSVTKIKEYPKSADSKMPSSYNIKPL